MGQRPKQLKTMTVGRREILFGDPRETERLIGRVLAGKIGI